jgi:hypothetical protein
MSLPPFQTDPRTQKLPEQLAIHPVGSAVLLVTHPEELPAALKQHEKPVVIENTPANARLRRDFELLLRWQRWGDTNRLLGFAALVFIVFTQMVMSNRYNLEASWHSKWNVIELDGKITLSPSDKW